MPSDADHLTLLGAGNTTYPTTPDEATLETIPWMSGPTICEWDAPEFTSVCPKTAQPDFARIRIRMSVADALIESKALKLYLFSFRSMGMFHERVIARIADDIAHAAKPHWLLVRGEFTPRGGISIWPLAARVTRAGVVERVEPSDVINWNEWSR